MNALMVSLQAELSKAQKQIEELKADLAESQAQQRKWQEAGAAEASIHGETMARLDAAEQERDEAKAELETARALAQDLLRQTTKLGAFADRAWRALRRCAHKAEFEGLHRSEFEMAGALGEEIRTAIGAGPAGGSPP